MMGLVRRLNAAGHTIVMVTHAMDVAAAYARRTILMQNGRIVADGSTREIFANAPLLERLGLSVPPLIQVANRLGIPALRPDELVGALKKRGRDGDSGHES